MYAIITFQFRFICFVNSLCSLSCPIFIVLSISCFSRSTHCKSCSTISVFFHFNFLDVNECDDNPNYCQVGGQCVNTPGSYRCLCKEGYEVGNGGSHCIGKRLFNSFSFINSCVYIRSSIRIKADRVKKRVLLPKKRYF